MKKLVVWAIVLILCFSISGCSNNVSNQFAKERTHKSEEDKIKFYDFEWLTTREQVEKKFDNDFGKGKYKSSRIEYYHLYINDNITRYRYIYEPTEENGVLTNVGGYNVSDIYIDYICDNKDIDNANRQYLCLGGYTFGRATQTEYNDLNSILNKQYNFKETKESELNGGTIIRYTDNNNNEVGIIFRGETTYEDNGETKTREASISIEYGCMDILKDYEEREQEKRKSEKNDSKGL